MFLMVTVSVVTVYAYNHQDSSDVTQYMNVRDQSEDYDHLFDNYNFKSFTIEFEPDVFDSMIANMQDHFDIYGDYIDNTMYPVNFTYQDNYGSITVLEVGFRTSSSTSRNLPRTIDWRDRYVYHQTSFQLQFNETFEYLDNTNIYQILKTREVFNLEQLNFEYSQIYDGDYDEAMISEAFSQYLYREAGLIVSNASYGIVYLKIGEELISYGFFTVVEPIDSEFLKANFRSDKALEYGDLYKVTDIQGEGALREDYEDMLGVDGDTFRYTYSLRNNTLDGTRINHDAFIDFIEAVNEYDYFLGNYEKIIDYDMFARYLAIAFLIGNSDDIRYNYNNYYIYFDVYTSVATIIPFDLDASLGFGKHLDLSGNYGVDYNIGYNLDDVSPLVDDFFRTLALVTMYQEYLVQFIEDFFNYQTFLAMYLDAKSLYENILVSEGHLGNKVFSTRNLEWYFTEKTSSVLEQIQ